jgi:ABC-type nitrate/sulfonate/bicarbonate transport system substrate-binding protein
MQPHKLMLLAGILSGILLIAGCVTPTPPVQDVVSIIYTQGTGPMPTLLATGQIDGYIAWQPFVSVAPLANIGKVLEYSQNLPPDERWKNHPCCVFAVRDDTLAENPDLVNALTAATILSTRYINEHPNESAEITADWLAGKGNFTYGDISVSSVEVLEASIPTVRYTNEPSQDWIEGNLEFVYALRELGLLKGQLATTTDSQTEALLFDTAPYYTAEAMIQNGSIKTPAKVDDPIGIGYLNSDHHASLFVAVKNWQYFNDTYGIALKPRDLTASRPDVVDLIVNGKPVAELHLIVGPAGPSLMQLAATDQIQVAYVGDPPTISAIDTGTPVKIVMALQTEGSGVVVSNDSPATNWTTFVEWAKLRAESGKPLKIADPGKGSIQDVMLRYALEESDLSVKEG